MTEIMGDSSPVAALENRSGGLARCERRLQALGRVLNHDFPNQLVIIQGLVQLLALEESERLSADGREYVRRLAAAAARVLDMGQGLKTLARLGTAVEKATTPLVLRDLAGDLVRQVKQLFPNVNLHFDFPPSAPAVKAERRALHQAMVELIRYMASGQTGANVIELSARPCAAAMELRLAPRAPVASSNRIKADESRLEWLLARELVESWGGTLRVAEEPGGGKFFSILVPERGTLSSNEGLSL